MIISTKYRFVFLANRKCASSSIVHALRPFANAIAESDPRLRHTNFKAYKQFIEPWLQSVADDTTDYKVYALFREPVEWLCSWYRFRHRPEISDHANPQYLEYTGGVSWDNFLDQCFSASPPTFAMVGNQFNFVADAEGNIGPNSLYRYDCISRLVDDLSDRVGKRIDLPRLNESIDLPLVITPEHYVFCRERMAADYGIYDSLLY